MTEVFVITVWDWDWENNLRQEYISVSIEHDDALKYISDNFNFGNIKKVIDCDDSFDAYKENGQYGSPSIVEIIKKTFSDSDDKVDNHDNVYVWCKKCKNHYHTISDAGCGKCFTCLRLTLNTFDIEIPQPAGFD